MRKVKIALGVLLAFAAVAAAAFPWYLGWETEQCFVAGLNNGALGKNSPVSVTSGPVRTRMVALERNSPRQPQGRP